MSAFSFIQFIGTQRSGSNLLRLMLNEHSQISAPHPPHLLKTFYPLLERYGDIGAPERRSSLVSDMCDWVEANPVSWNGVALDREKITAQSRDILDVFEVIYRSKMVHEGKRTWCCKSMFNLHFFEQFESKWQPFYLYIYRDGRDVAASFQRAIVGDKHPYHLATRWNLEQQKSLRIVERVGDDRTAVVRYEDLILNPRKVLESICEKLGVGYEERMLHYYESTESRKTAESGRMWSNVARPILSNNHGNFKNKLAYEDIQLFEQIAGASLEQLGYQKSVNGQAVAIDVEGFDSINEEMKAKVRAQAPPHDLHLRQRQFNLMDEIERRLAISDH